MGIFYNPPPASQGPVNSTPPIPHVAIGTQGSQPPRMARATAVMMVAVLASWPADLEPRLQRPNDTQKTKIAPLTLTYGQQPPRQPPMPYPTTLTQLVASWPTDVRVPPRGQSTSWFPTVIAQVPAHRSGTIHPAILQTIQELTPRILVVPSGVVAPENPDSPPRQSPLSAASVAITLQAWQPIPPILLGPESAAWNVPPLSVVVPRTPPPAHLWTAWQPPFIAPPRPVTIAPLTLTYGAQPIPIAPLELSTLLSTVARWVETWDAQRAAPQASWNVPPILISLPRTPLPAHIWTAWEPPFIAPPKPVSIAPLTLVYGAQPRPQAPLALSTYLHTVGLWVESWPAQTQADNAAINIPPVFVPYRPLAQGILTALQPPWVGPPKPVQIVTLTLPTGTPPPIGPPIRPGVMLAILINNPAQSWGTQTPRLGEPGREPSPLQHPDVILFDPMFITRRVAWDATILLRLDIPEER